ncbi:SpaA isopeptide-forming pilin-related protein [Longicatena caecimuris]|uniref:SpaA isopeptide-forming pilin-related protein n=1 Tax=Longicatena caecimuris TaxID=1796635 RepID=UPI00210E0DE0|nr:SpaA isopeptide-forming pilin-related protein [Longicatena caecimuris]MCQ5292184.1 SpaA isopeptide-forming pilin-related protein [Longicatena caecimuris]
MKTLKKPLSLLMALFMCLGMFAGTGVTAFAAGETMTTYMVDIPRANDPNKAGWGHPALNFLGGWSTSAGTHFSVHTQDAYNGRAIYCIEPGIGVHSGDQYTGRGEDFWDNYPSSLNPTIPPNTIKEYIGRIMTYGWQGNASTSWMSSNPDHANQMAGYIATQLLVWETIVGERDSQFNHVDANAQGKNNVTEYISAEHPLRSQIFSQYSAIESAVKRHTMLPSFFSSTADAGAYELKWDGEKYSATLTDTNGVLGDYTFSSSTAGLNFSVDGSQLTITSSQALKGSVTVKAEKISAQRSGVVVWTDGVTGGGTQDFATYGTTVSDQMVGYLNLEVKTGNMKLIKTSEDGKVEGISFTITGEGYNATKTTNAAGEIDITDLNPGVYTVTEQSIDKYEPQATQRVTIVSGQTATVTFNNVLKRGSLEVTKTSEDGLAEGMTFHLSGTSLSGLPVDEYAVTDSTGVARFENVLIGTGYVLEEVDTPIRYVVPEAQTATIEWNEVTDKTVNNILKKFRVTVTKSDVETGTPQGDGSLAGATYGLYKGDTLIDSFTTDENGQFTTGYYVCDSDWTIREINPSEGYLVDSTIHHVGAEPELYTIELNDTANDVTEQIIKGDIAIIKHTDDGETGIETPEEGAEFQIYLKAAGSYDAAKDSERDVLVCDENGFAQSKKLPYGTYIVHQTKGWEGRELMDDFEVYISQDGQTYRYLINNAAFESYIKVVKVDAETGVTIPYAGAGFQIYRPDGSKVEMTFTYPTPTTIDTFYTNAEGYLVTPEKLEYGSGYSLVEVQAPYGYVLDSTPVYFDVTEDNSTEEGGVTVIEVTKSNMAQKGVIKVSKTGEVFSSVQENEGVYQPVYEVTGLPGAVFEITALEDVYTPDGTLRYSAGEVVDTITTGEDGTAQSQPLYLGKFQVKEIEFPHGMADTGENITEVELVYAGQEVEITETSASFYNQRQKALVTLDKVLEQDETFGIGMNGEITAVTFGLYAQEDITAADGFIIPADGLLEIVSVDENGQAMCKTDLPFGSFYLKELSTDSHYLLNGETFPFSFEYGGPSLAVVEIAANNGEAVSNELIRGEIRGLKTDENGTGLSRAVIGLFQSDETEFTAENALATATSAEDGSFSFADVPFGDWVLKELESPAGFILSDEVIPVTVEEDGQVVEISLANERIYGNLRLTKVDKDYPDNKLTGAEFEVYRDTNGNKELDEGDELLGKMEETSTGIYEMAHILYGGVFVKETKAPEGFLLDENAYYVEIAEHGKIYEVENEAGKGFVNAAQTGSLRIEKTSSDGKVEGFSFRVTGANGYDQTFKTDKNGEIHIEGLRVGDYTVSEVSDGASASYVLPADKTVTILADKTTVAQMHNELRDTPKTGDDSKPWLWMALMGVSAAGAATLGILGYVNKRKKGNKSAE